MPKQTFFNLSLEKQERIKNAAIEEFSKYSFSNSSINRIIQVAKIPKGSFYQYFENKEDIYIYIIEEIGKVKIKYIQNNINDFSKKNIFEIIQLSIESSLKMISEYPKYAEIGLKMMNEDTNFINKIINNLKINMYEFLSVPIKNAVNDGLIDENLDIDLLIFFISKVLSSVSEYAKEKDIKDFNEIADLTNKIMYMIENGIRRREQNDKN
ncbi:TetR family transcriptional regulator [Tepiditoga spiralis]|uniref:TetR family transcriptional regulator n=1 Tax=Tepiditoga spiralis TaxID=2108365 RepID=A0A7G1G811_9BACT|nr:TetR/AcrR family transcriptional regulator [Tepiditoga spiralis]BBE30152.1 TetR family transcriptional regulator [Tepiditoga spiralis]